MSLSNDNVITKRPVTEPAQEPQKSSSGWLNSINPFASTRNNDDIGVDSAPAPAPAPAPTLIPVDDRENQSSNQSSSSGWFDFSFKKIAVIIIILLFLGFNVLKMSGQGLDYLGSVGKVLFGSIGIDVSDTIKKTINNTATGSKEVVDISKDVAIDVVDDTEKLLGGKSESKKKEHDKAKKDNENLAQAVNNSTKKEKEHVVVPDDAGSTVQQSKGAGKAGWCFVGEDRGFRSCVRVGINDDCISGDIFPSNDLCINPTLRE